MFLPHPGEFADTVNSERNQTFDPLPGRELRPVIRALAIWLHRLATVVWRKVAAVKVIVTSAGGFCRVSAGRISRLPRGIRVHSRNAGS